MISNLIALKNSMVYLKYLKAFCTLKAYKDKMQVKKYCLFLREFINF